MNISSISGFSVFSNKKSASFKGQTTDYKIMYGKEDLKNNSFWHNNSTVESTVGSHHKNYTGKVYFASPMEFVGDKIKDSVDYVVYDNEPAYPAIEEIEKNYTGKLRKDFRKDFEEVREYYYRREMGGFANVEEAKAKQKQAAECTGFYDRAGAARYEKETLEDNVNNIERCIKYREDEISNLKKGIIHKNEEKSILEIKQNNYTQKQSKYGQLKELAEKTIERDNEELGFIYVQIEKLKKNIADCKKKIEACIHDIRSMETGIKTNQARIMELQAEKQVKNNSIKNIIDTQLKPMFEGLKKFYTEQGIKVIKRG